MLEVTCVCACKEGGLEVRRFKAVARGAEDASAGARRRVKLGRVTLRRLQARSVASGTIQSVRGRGSRAMLDECCVVALRSVSRRWRVSSGAALPL